MSGGRFSYIADEMFVLHGEVHKNLSLIQGMLLERGHYFHLPLGNRRDESRDRMNDEKRVRIPDAAIRGIVALTRDATTNYRIWVYDDGSVVAINDVAFCSVGPVASRESEALPVADMNLSDVHWCSSMIDHGGVEFCVDRHCLRSRGTVDPEVVLVVSEPPSLSRQTLHSRRPQYAGEWSGAFASSLLAKGIAFMDALSVDQHWNHVAEEVGEHRVVTGVTVVVNPGTLSMRAGEIEPGIEACVVMAGLSK